MGRRTRGARGGGGNGGGGGATTSPGASEHVRDQVEKGRKKVVFKVGGEQRGVLLFFPILDFGLELEQTVGAAT